MATSARVASPLETRKARSVPALQASTNFFNYGGSINNREIEDAQQHLTLVPRIIALHWLRPGSVEAING